MGLRPISEGFMSTEPWRMMIHRFCDSGSMTKPRHPGHLPPWGLTAGTLQWCNAKSGPGNARRVEGCFERRHATRTVGATREVRAFVDLEVVCRHFVLRERVRRPHQATNLLFKGTPPTCIRQSVNVRGKEHCCPHIRHGKTSRGGKPCRTR